MTNDLPKRKTMRLQGCNYSTPAAYFITICTEGRKRILSSVGTGVPDGPSKIKPIHPQVRLTKFGEVADKYINQLDSFYKHISVDYYVIMPNHVHMILVIKGTKTEISASLLCGPSRTPVPTDMGGDVRNSEISKFISTFKRFCNKEYGKNVWQKRSYDHIIRNSDDYYNTAKYILENPATWQQDELYVT